VLALIAEVTDMADGYIARKHNQVSDTGKLLDPYADKIWRFSAFLCIGMRGYADLWMIAIIFWRMLTVSHLRTIAVMKGRVIAARASGKIKAIIQGCGIILVLLCAAAQRYTDAHSVKLPFSFRYIAWWIMCAVTLVTFLSAIDYFHAHRDVIKNT
jgi:CDP-diacylglycerol--glycerol-3-phosphate 3-phosphatidyltransferase